MDNTCRNSGQKFRQGHQAVNIAAAIVSESLWSVLARAYGQRRHATEMLARDAEVTPATASNWLRRRCVPQAEQLIALMASCDELAAEVQRLVEERKRKA